MLVKDWFRKHQKLLAYLALSLGGILAFYRVHHVTDELGQKQEQLDRLTKKLDKVIHDQQNDRAITSLSACQLRNSQALGVRQSFDDAFDVIGGNNKVIAEIKAKVAAKLSRTPDRDCDENGVVNTSDYLPDDNVAHFIEPDAEGGPEQAVVKGLSSVKGGSISVKQPSATTSTTIYYSQTNPAPLPQVVPLEKVPPNVNSLIDPVCGLNLIYLELC